MSGPKTPTERLYYRDSFQREFDAEVISCEKDGERWKVFLDRTSFYPTSGGQPHDLGTLGGVPVVEVADAEDRNIAHFTSAEVPLGPVHGAIDWPRRIDHMQQHTGQHLLSAVFIERFKFQTVSFHLGRDVSTIDLATTQIVPRHLEEAERHTNEIILEDRVVAVRFGTAAELAAIGVRKEVDREGILRAIEIEGADLQPCGGTHLSRTGQAGVLLLRGIERAREASRVEFVCGFRALAAARRDFSLLTQAATTLSCGLPDVPGAIAKVMDERKAQHSAAKRIEERLVEFEAQALLASQESQTGSGLRIISAVLPEAAPGYLTLLGSRLAAQAKNDAVVVLASGAGHVVIAQSKGSARDLGAVLRAVLKELGGKGGGSKNFAQGSLASATAAAVEAFVARAKDVLL
jgi:alanyl-tRNA synthetase